jgi:hypothetical protein
VKRFFIISLLLLLASNAFACRYNVRETGFVYLAQKPYQLSIHYSNTTPAEDIELIKELSSNYFNDSNIEPLLVKQQTDSRPTAVLKSPDGQSMRFPLLEKNSSLEESVKSVFRKISYSKIRGDIVDKCISNYGVILLFEGTDTEANKRAIREAKEAIEHIKSKMSLLPKEISNPPTLITIKIDVIDSDKIIPWVFGLKKDSPKIPKSAIIYGRARWIGPILEGDEISKRNLSELLLIIGADCECGIDRDWMRGTMIPVTWDIETRKKVTNELEFDPENPLIKKEVRHILRMGEIFAGTSQKDTIDTNEFNTTPEYVNRPKETNNTNLKSMFFKALGLSLFILIIGVAIFNKKKN